MTVGLFFAALASWVGGGWDDLDPAAPLRAEATELVEFPALSELLAEGRRLERVRLLACSASTRLLGLDPADVQRSVDAIVGWPTFHRLARSAGTVVCLS